jgi:hypothetical protein
MQMILLFFKDLLLDIIFFSPFLLAEDLCFYFLCLCKESSKESTADFDAETGLC